MIDMFEGGMRRRHQDGSERAMGTGETRYARDEVKHLFFADIVERCTDAVVTAVGAPNVAALFMIGAPSRGEATVLETSSGCYSLSDVDLVCVTAANADVAAARVSAAAAIARLNREIADVCVGVDAAIKPFDIIGHFPPLISNFELVRTPVLLRGDPSMAEHLGRIRIEDIPPEDALRFVHNRCIEQLLAGRGASVEPSGTSANGPVQRLHDAPDPRAGELTTLHACYRTAKLMLDLVTAFLFVRRNVPVSYTDRVRLFVDTYCAREEFSAVAHEIEPYCDQLHLWAEFKTTGDSGAVQKFVTDETQTEMYAMPFARAIWKRVLGDVLGEDLSLASLPRALGRCAALEGPARSLARSLRTARDGRTHDLFPTGVVLRGALNASPKARAYLTGLLLFFSGFGTGLDACAPTLNAPRDWTRRALARYAPFSLPAEFASLSDAEMRELLLDRLARFHQEVLLGRVTEPL
ncbi:hypothetical protein K8S17_05025 [bacterium]|nr:hypothetical protein [bacterium]